MKHVEEGDCAGNSLERRRIGWAIPRIIHLLRTHSSTSAEDVCVVAVTSTSGGWPCIRSMLDSSIRLFMGKQSVYTRLQLAEPEEIGHGSSVDGASTQM